MRGDGAMTAQQIGAESSRGLAALPGTRRYRCGGCRHERVILGIATDPDCCGVCGRPWTSVSETTGAPATTPRVISHRAG
jgi:hypothetical protein